MDNISRVPNVCLFFLQVFAVFACALVAFAIMVVAALWDVEA